MEMTNDSYKFKSPRLTFCVSATHGVCVCMRARFCIILKASCSSFREQSRAAMAANMVGGGQVGSRGTGFAGGGEEEGLMRLGGGTRRNQGSQDTGGRGLSWLSFIVTWEEASLTDCNRTSEQSCKGLGYKLPS